MPHLRPHDSLAKQAERPSRGETRTGRVLSDLDRIMEAATDDRLRDLMAALLARVSAGTARIACRGDRQADGPTDENLSAAEAAKRLGMSRSWLYANAHRLPFARHIGRRVLFSAQGLERWSRNRERP